MRVSEYPRQETHLDEEFCRQSGELILHVPVHKRQWLSQNSRMGWRQEAAMVKTLRHIGYLTGLSLKNDTSQEFAYRWVAGADRVKVVALIHPLRRGTFDPGNAAASVKPIIDGLTDAGYWADDNGAHLLGPDYRPALPTGTPGEYRIDLHITGYRLPARRQTDQTKTRRIP